MGYNAVMRDKPHPLATLLTAHAIFLAAFAFYVHHLPINHTYDGMVFASYVENQNVSNWDLFHPHHLLYNPLGRALHQWGLAHGAQWDGLCTLQFLDVMIGSVGLILAYFLVLRLTRDPFSAFWTALGLSLTYSYWYFSTTPAVRILGAVTPLMAWCVLAASQKWGYSRGPALGAAHLLAVLGHQTNLLLLPAFLAGLWAEAEVPWRRKFRDSILYSVFLLIGTLGVYVFIGRFVVMRMTLEKWTWWLTAYFHVNAWGGNLKPSGLEQGQMGMTLAFLGNVFPGEKLAGNITYGAVKLLLLLSLVGFVLLAVMGARFLWRQQRPALLVSVFWLAAFIPFFIWWEPWNIEFWVSSTIPFWVLMGLTLAQSVRTDLSNGFWANPAVSGAKRWLLLTLAFGAVGLMGLYNYEAKIRKSPETYAHKTLLAALKTRVRVDDLLVVSGANTIPMYLDRFQKRKYIDLNRFLLRRKKDAARRASRAGSKAQAGHQGPLSALDSEFRSVWRRHRRVYVLSEVVDPSNRWMARVEKQGGLQAGDLRRFILRYPTNEVRYKDRFFFIEVKPRVVSKPPVKPGLPREGP